MGKKMKIMAAAAAFGVMAAGVNMFFISRPADAAVVVMDEKNIEQTAEHLIKTATILTTEEKKLALMLLHAKKFSPELLMEAAEYYGKNNVFISECLQAYKDAQNKKQGMNSTAGAIQSVILEDIGMVDDVLNGKTTVFDAYFKAEQQMRKTEEVIKDAAKTSQSIYGVTLNAAEANKKALEMTQQAEGSNEMQQAANYLLATQNDIQTAEVILRNKELELQARKMQQENYDRARAERYKQDVYESLDNIDFSCNKKYDNW